MANGNVPPGLPGGQILSVIMAAPTDILTLISGQAQQGMATLNAGVTKLSAAAAQAAATPPIPIPGMAGFPLSFPGFPGAAGAPGGGGGAGAAAAPTGGQAPTYTSGSAATIKRATIQT